MSYSQAVQTTNKTKCPKMVFNLRDVNKAPELTHGVSENVMHFQRYHKQYSMYMVEHAEVRAHNHNIHLGKYPNPRPKRGIK